MLKRLRSELIDQVLYRFSPYAVGIAACAVMVAALIAVSGGAISAQDKYTVQVPDGLVFAEFRGYEDWQSSSGCYNFQAPAACRFVQGDISPNGWCQLFAPKT
jgi:hypothetical protein